MWWYRENKGAGKYCRRRRSRRVASGWLAACATVGLVAGCFPPLSEVGNGSGGEGGETVAASGGSGGMFARSGNGGSAGVVTPPSKGGAGPVAPTGGAPERGGDLDNAGTPSSMGGEANGGSSEGGTGGTVPPPDQGEVEAETIERWNAIADHRDADVYNFHWTHDMFPHPTFAAMGEAEGYQEFAFVLDAFLGTHFDFLAAHRQFLTPYYYVTASPADVDLEVTWDELATDFSTLTYGDIPEEVQADLAGYARDMKAFE